MAKKQPKRSATKSSSKPAKAARRPSPTAPRTAKAATAKAPAKPAAAPRSAAPSAGPTLGERAERLRDDILRSKLTHPDPWAYATKARTWGDRAQTLVETIGLTGDTPATRSALDALDREVLGDRAFQEARRLF